MAKKAELERAYADHLGRSALADKAETAHEFRSALNSAVESLSSLRDALAHHRRYVKGDSPPTASVGLILRLAPPLFARRALDAVEACVADWKKAERDALPGLADDLGRARRRLAFAVRLWADLRVPPQTDGGRDTGEEASSLLKVWVRMGLVSQVGSGTAGRHVLVTDTRRDAWGKCPGCGHKQLSPLASILKPMRCGSCGQVRPFVITRRAV